MDRIIRFFYQRQDMNQFSVLEKRKCKFPLQTPSLTHLQGQNWEVYRISSFHHDYFYLQEPLNVRERIRNNHYYSFRKMISYKIDVVSYLDWDLFFTQ